MLAACLAGNPRFERAAHERADAGQAEQSIQQGRPLRRRRLGDDAPGRGIQFAGGDQAVHQAHRQGAIGPHRFACQHQFHGRAHAEHLHAAHRAAKARVNAQLHFGQAERQAPVVDADPVTAGQGNFQAAAERKTLDRRHGGAGQCRQLIAHLLAVTDQFQRFSLALELGEFAYVGAGDEAGFLAGAQDQATRRLRLQRAQVRAELLHDGAAQRICRCVRTVERQRRNVIGAAAQLPGSCFAHVSPSRLMSKSQISGR